MNFSHFAGEGGGIISAATSSVTNSPSDRRMIATAGWIGAVAVILLSMVYDSIRKTYSNLPPGPRNWPVIGAILDMEPKFHEAFTKLARKYGPILYLRLGVQNVVVISSAEIAEEVLKHKDGIFAHRSVLMSRTAAKYAGFEGELFAYNDKHAEHILRRKLAIKEFFTPAKLRTYDELRRQEMAVMVQKVFNTVENASKSNGDPKSNGSAKGAVTVGIKETATEMIRNIMFALVIREKWGLISTE